MPLKLQKFHHHFRSFTSLSSFLISHPALPSHSNFTPSISYLLFHYLFLFSSPQILQIPIANDDLPARDFLIPLTTIGSFPTKVSTRDYRPFLFLKYRLLFVLTNRSRQYFPSQDFHIPVNVNSQETSWLIQLMIL